MVLVVGDRVSNRKATHSGELVDIDGQTGTVLQANGVEVEFPISELKPWEAPKANAVPPDPRDAAMSPQHRRLLASMPAEILAAVAKSYDGEAGARPAFAALPDARRLETVRIYLPSLPQRLLARHMNLVIAMRDLAKAGR